MEVCVYLFVESNGALAIVGSSKLSCAGYTNNSALLRALYGHALSSMFVADQVVTRSIKIDNNFSILLYPYSF